MTTRPTRGVALTPNTESGSTLMVAMIFVVIMLVSIAAVLTIGSQDTSLALGEIRSSRALYLAEAGIERTQAWLEGQEDPPESTSVFYPFGQGPDTLGRGAYVVSVLPDSANPVSSRKIYTVASTATVGGRTRTLESDFSTRSFAEYIYFTDGEHLPWSPSTPIWFMTADYIDGAVHTNDQIHIMGDPIFGGRVTSAYGGPWDPEPSHNPMFMYYNGSYWSHIESAAPSNPPHDEPTFEQGYQLGVPSIELPEVLDKYEDLAEAGGIKLDGNYLVILSRGGAEGYGYVSYRPLSGGDWTDVPISSFNGMLFVDGRVDIEGTLDGVLTVASTDDMKIIDDVVYRASDGDGPLPDCDDVLGLVSESNIIVANTTANLDDCVIHAHMMALNTSFQVEDYNSGDPRGALTVHGGIIQRCRGPVGTGNIYGIKTGYAKDYHYDPRFQETQPPGYFQTGTYVRLAWREVEPCAG